MKGKMNPEHLVIQLEVYRISHVQEKYFTLATRTSFLGTF